MGLEYYTLCTRNTQMAHLLCHDNQVLSLYTACCHSTETMGRLYSNTARDCVAKITKLFVSPIP